MLVRASEFRVHKQARNILDLTLPRKQLRYYLPRFCITWTDIISWCIESSFWKYLADINDENIFIRIIQKLLLDIVLIFVRRPKFIVIIQITLQTNLSKIVYDSDGKKINLDLLTYTDNSRSENEKRSENSKEWWNQIIFWSPG